MLTSSTASGARACSHMQQCSGGKIFLYHHLSPYQWLHGNETCICIVYLKHTGCVKKKKKKRQFQSVCIYLFSEKVNPKGFCFKGTDLSAVDKKMNVAVTSIIYQIECD